MNLRERAFVVLCGLVPCFCGCDTEVGGKKEACSAKVEAACIAADSGNGYGKCIWEAGACAAPSAVSACATYKDEGSCTAACTWANGACTGPTGGSGMECAEYTTQAACEIPCAWAGTECVLQ